METLTPAAYARHRGISRAGVHKAIRSGRIDVGPDGRIDPVAADAAWSARTDPTKVRGRTAGSTEYRRAQAIHSYWQGMRLRLEVEKELARLVDAKEVRKAAREAARRVQEQFEGLPDRVAPIIAQIDDPAQIHAILTLEIKRELRALAASFGTE